MSAALAFGRRAFGTTAPNPCVAALVVRDGVLLGRGITAPGGRPHAEPQALEQAGEGARGATLYVTLEPCSHVGRGRPCVEAILAAGIARVVVACDDPDPRVGGAGIASLRRAGIVVATGVAAAAARRDHRGHVCRIRAGRPAITLKLAETADGSAAAPPGQPRLMITGPLANAWVHGVRAMHDAVLIGKGTARADDPRLTVRLPGLDGRRPTRIVLDRDGDLGLDSHLVLSARTHPVLLVTGATVDAGKARALGTAGVVLAEAPLDAGRRLDLRAVARLLAGRGFTRVFCEGGPRIAAALLDCDLVDELDLLTAPQRLATPGLPALHAGARELLSDRFELVEDRSIGNDRLRRYERRDPCSPD